MLGAIIKNIHTVFSDEAKANAVAAQIQRDDPDWSYSVVPDPKGSGRAVIEIRDEDGVLIGKV